jgi:hypothetical protein
MIKYALKCNQGHQFDGWFTNSTAYDTQSAAGQICCPVCGINDVQKALMAPNVHSRRQEAAKVEAFKSHAPQTEALELMRKFKKFVHENSEYVGPRFADEAMKIHNEEAEVRSIHGEASESEADRLRKEGVEFYPLPLLPEDHN